MPDEEIEKKKENPGEEKPAEEAAPAGGGEAEAKPEESGAAPAEESKPEEKPEEGAAPEGEEATEPKPEESGAAPGEEKTPEEGSAPAEEKPTEEGEEKPEEGAEENKPEGEEKTEEGTATEEKPAEGEAPDSNKAGAEPLSKEDMAAGKLEKDKKWLEEKCKSMAKIIELSAKHDPDKKKAQGFPVLGDKDMDKNLEYLKNSVKNMKKSLKLMDPEKRGQEMKMLMTKIDAQSKTIDKITNMEAKIQDIEKKLTQKEQETQVGEENIFGGFGTLGAKGEQAEAVPKSMKELMNYMETFKGGMEERLLNLEKRTDSIRTKLGNDTLKKLETLVASKDRIENKMIPKRVREEVEKILSTFSFEMENLSRAIKDLVSDLEKSNYEMESIFNWIGTTNERVNEMESKLDNQINATDARIKHFEGLLGDLQRDYRLIDILKSEIKRKPDKMGFVASGGGMSDRFKELVEVVEAVESEKDKDKKMRALKDLDLIYKKGTISRELYEEILKKLN